ncbi:anti-anti-sigma factor [Actinoplanes octamycinicus]|uniref:Anti-sigma factor antagonist n=1 Tax=Actinoplanes octamycinicus TaxID=135948 RepID=A0A7W7M8U2_9ACTN|nr:STAS domain-containing protein [Actinoplanes octamycinicus]MBB4741274.1 anti-anti-sigma factor [Actinoplanes octamycinicus]GIE56185.1 hypothetical protein Aoc01nite_15870 [Actinoplanes octamycinicus]
MTDYFAIVPGPVEAAPDGQTTIRVRLAGSLDLGTGGELREALRRVVGEGGADRIVVDLARVNFIDSEAISALIAGYHAAEDAGVTFRLTGPAGIVQRVLTVVGLTDLID